MTTTVAIQWDASKSMGGLPRRVLLTNDVFVSQAELSNSAVVVHGLHHAHYAFCHAGQPRLGGVLRVNTTSGHQRTCRISTRLHFVAELSPDSTPNEQQRLSRIALESLQADVIRWALLLFSRLEWRSCSLMDAETVFPLLRALPFTARVAAMEAAARRYGRGLVLWRDNNLVSASLTSPLVALSPPVVNSQRVARAAALAAATVCSLSETPLPELLQHVNHLHRRVQRCLMEDPRDTLAASSALAVALVIALQVVASFTEFANMCPSARACLSGNLYALYAAGAFRASSAMRQHVAHVMRKKSLKTTEFVPVFELLISGALTPRLSSWTSSVATHGATVTGAADEGGASTFFSSQYEEPHAAQALHAEAEPTLLRHVVAVALMTDTLSSSVLDHAELLRVLASSAKVPSLSPRDHLGALGYMNILTSFGTSGKVDCLQLTVEPSLLKRSAAAD